MTMPDLLLMVHAAATWFMVGVIWFVQVVHYPLFAAVGETGFVRYGALHRQRTGWVVVPPMVVELATALVIAARPPAGLLASWAWTGAALVLLVWAATFLLQVPCHARLGRGFDPPTHRRLVLTNVLRTAGWTARGVLALAFLGV
jgi:hypothetical protein